MGIFFLEGGDPSEAFHCYDDYWVNDNGVIKWHNKESHQKRKAQKPQIKKELMHIAWHPSRWWDWCMSEDEKRETEKIMDINMYFFVSDDQIQKIDPRLGLRM